MLISVIVPCFDVEAYVDECLAGVVAQTHDQLEILVVDDGSTDSTAARVGHWVGLDARIRTIRQANAGLGAARNAGLASATGDAIFFLDGDDRLPPSALERLAASADATGSDIVCGVINVIASTGTWRATQQRSAYDHDRRRTHLFELPDLVYDPMVCGKLFRRSFWDANGLSFRHGVLFEDVEVMMAAHCAASSIDVVSSVSYEWRRRESGPPSITGAPRDARTFEHRFAAVERADRVLETRAPTGIWEEHGRKILHVDLREQSRALVGARAPDAGRFVEAARPMLARIAPGAVERAAPMMRMVRELVLAGDATSLVAAASLYSGTGLTAAGRARAAGTIAVRRPRALSRLLGRMVSGRFRGHSVPSRSSAPPSTTIS